MSEQKNKINKSRITTSDRASTSNRPLMLGNMSENQFNCFLSMRKFEEKKSAKIGRSGILAKTLSKEVNVKKKFLSGSADLAVKEYFKVASQIRIPATVTLNLPNSTIQLIKKNKLEKILVTPGPKTSRVKITLTDKNGIEKILVPNQENYFRNRPRKNAKIGLIISEDSPMSMSIPQSPISIESNSSKIQGNVLYKLGVVGVN